MIYGIGCDLCSTARMAKSLGGAHGPAFAARVFGPSEREALGLAGPFVLCEIEAVRLESGAPESRFSGGSARWMAAHSLRASLSLSHDGGMALAFCILDTET